MNPHPLAAFFRRRSRGSAFVTVMMFTCVLLILSGSIINWSVSERRLNTRSAYWLEARNAGEAVAEYGFAQVATQFNKSATPPTFDPSGANPLAAPPTAFFSGGHVDSAAYTSSHTAGIELIGGTSGAVPSSGALYYVDPKNPDNQFDTLKGQYVYRRDVQVLARATVTPLSGAGSPITVYVTEKVSIRGAPLFAHAIFYSNNDLEVFPGPVMNIYGPVHCNGNLFLSSQGNSLSFHGPVSCTGDLYHAWANSNSAAEGAGGETIGQTPVNFDNTAGTAVNLNATGAATGWKDSTMGASNGVTGLSNLQALITPAIATAFRKNAAQTWNGNVQTGAMGVQAYNPISFSEVIDAAGDTPDPHSLIDAPDTTLVTTDPYYTAKAALEQQKLSMQTGLYVQVTVSAGAGGAGNTYSVNLYGPSGAGGTGPNGGVQLASPPAGLVSFVPFRAAATGNTTTTATQTSYSAVAGTGVHAGSYQLKTTTKSGGTWTQTASAAYNGASTAPTVTNSGGAFSGGATSNSTGATWIPNATALPSTTVGLSGSPTTTINNATYALTNGMYDQRRDMGVDQVVLDVAALKKAVQEMVSSGSSGSTANAITKTDGSAWTDWNGAVYIDVRAPNFQTSAQSASVTLINGHVTSGQSLLPAYGANGSGLTIATNAPVYVKGDFNAAGGSSPTSAEATTPDDGHSGASGDGSAESPVCIAADCVTLLSNSWSDATSYSTNSPAASNTEFAAALLVGLQPTTNGASSGGAHNLPRFLESWSSKTATIRGSLVTMYSCKVGTQPWSTSYYSPPNRNWGFDKIFQNGHYPPITPKVMSYRRVDFTELTPAAYGAARHALWPSVYTTTAP